MNTPQNILTDRSRRGGSPFALLIDLSVAQTDQIYSITGSRFYVQSSPDQTSSIQVKINTSDSSAFTLTKQQGFKKAFEKLFITTPAGQTGTMVILISNESSDEFEFIDNVSSVSAAMSGVLAELQGDVTPENWGAEKTVGNTTPTVPIIAQNANRKGAIIQAKSTNGGIVYVGFDATVASNKWVAELLPGMSFCIDDYRGDLYAIASAAGQLVGWGEW